MMVREYAWKTAATRLATGSNVHRHGRGLAGLAVVTWLALASPASAQFVCDSTTPGGSDGATATGVGSVACGTGATAVDTGLTAGGGSTAIGANAGVGAAATNRDNTALGASAGNNVTGYSNTATGLFAGTLVEGNSNAAYGENAGVSVKGSTNTAIGAFAGQTVKGDNNTASGYEAGSVVTGDDNTASGTLAGVNVKGDKNTASGYNAGRVVDGNRNAAYGANAGSSLKGDGNVAIGSNAGSDITADHTVSIGTDAVGSKTGAVAIGRDAKAEGKNAVALGVGAKATRDNQVAIGTNTSTYTLAGIGSAASLAAQTGPVRFTTSDASGNLALSNYGPDSIAALDAGFGKLSGEVAANRTEARQGIAAAIAMSSAPMPSAPGRTSWSTNVGYFKGETAFGGSLAYRFDFDNPIALSLGYSYGGDTSHAARLGMQGEF